MDASHDVSPLGRLAGVPSPEPGAFACVSRAWAAHQTELHHFLTHRLGDPSAAEDMLQETFMKAMREGEGFCSLDNPRAWLFRVARNALTDRHRLAKPLDSIDDHAHTLQQPEAEPAPAVDALTACLTRVLGELGAEDAAVLHACDIQGMGQKDYAGAHGLSLPAVKSRLLRARQRLRDRMALACRVQFDPVDGRVSGFDGRAGEQDPSGRR